jgi:hypothetical protein
VNKPTLSTQAVGYRRRYALTVSKYVDSGQWAEKKAVLVLSQLTNDAALIVARDAIHAGVPGMYSAIGYGLSNSLRGRADK